jgi:hypothetical protein
MNCDCTGWKKNVDALMSLFVISDIHSSPYMGELFKFCPWCGKLLEEQEKEERHE